MKQVKHIIKTMSYKSHSFCLVEEDGVLGESSPRKVMACVSGDVAE